MTENPDTADGLTEEEALADDAARLRDPAWHAIVTRNSGATAHALTARLAARYSTPASDDTAGGAA